MVRTKISATMWRDSTPQALTSEQELLKRHMYETMQPRRRKFIDRIGYKEWDPFQKPNDPMELRMDVSRRTTQQLVGEFLQSLDDRPVGNDFSKGVLDCALGLVNRDEKYQGIFEFCMWYSEILKEEGYIS